MSDVRVRFAPSPTGFLHIGGVRTALYAWLWARRHKGTFVLRIEDTDAERSTEEAVNTILESMIWLGLDWDEGPLPTGTGSQGEHGPYRQSERLALYREWADRLIASGHAFRCYATKEEIAAQRQAFAEAGKKGFRFRSPWRDRTDGDPDQPHSVRFRAPSEGATRWNDLVYGEMSYQNSEQQDFILLRPNGLPLYNFGCFVDDHTMGITLVTRGEDHLINTPQQLLLYAAAGVVPPQFAHLPLVLGPRGKKLSKREVDVGVLQYRDKGFVPDGLLNYLARLGWSHGDQEIFSRAELIEKFDWSQVGNKSGQWDQKKLEHVQAQHLREIPDAELAALVVPFLAKREIDVEATNPRLVAAIAPVQLRATTLDDLAAGLTYFFETDESLTIDEKGRTKFLKEEAAPILTTLSDLVEACEPFDAGTLEAQVKAWIEQENLKMKHVAQPARVALTGRTFSPGLYEVMALLGRHSAVTRLRRGAALAANR